MQSAKRLTLKSITWQASGLIVMMVIGYVLYRFTQRRRRHRHHRLSDRLCQLFHPRNWHGRTSLGPELTMTGRYSWSFGIRMLSTC